MSHTSDVGKLSSPPVVPVQPATPVQPIAELGGMPIRLEMEGQVRSGRTDAGKAFESFQARPLDVDMSWTLKPSEQTSSERASAATGKLVDHFASGHCGEDTLGHLDQMIQEAEHNFEVMTELSIIASEINSAARTNRFIEGEIEKAKETLSYLRADHMSDASNLLDALRSAGLDDTSGDDLRQQIDEAKADIKAVLESVKFAIFKGHLNDLHEVTAGVISISSDGVVDVELVDTPMSVKFADQTPAAFIETSGQSQLSGELKVIDGVEITSGAAADWPRMDISFALPGGTTSSTLAGSDGMHGSVQDLLALAGSKTAATVLSSVLNGAGLGEIAHRFGGANGQDVNFVPASGSAAPEDARMQVSRDPDGNFRVDVNWKLTSDHVVRDDGREASLTAATGPDGAMGLQITMTGSFVVSGADAQNGTLSILAGTTFNHRITGTL